MPVAGIGAALGIAGGIGQLFGAGKSNHELSKLAGQDPAYTANPLAAQQLGLAQTLLNARMPGAASMENNIYGTQANTLNAIDRNATDSSQALALAAGTQGQANNAFNQLGMEEAQDYQRRYGNLVGAQQNAINEGDKVYQDKVRRFQDQVQIKGAQQQNRQNAWGSVSNLGFGLMDFGMNGGFNGMFGGGGGQGGNPSQLKLTQIGANPDGSPHFGYR